MDELIVVQARDAFLATPPNAVSSDRVVTRVATGEFDVATRLGATILQRSATVAEDRIDAHLALASVALHQGRFGSANRHYSAAYAIARPNSVEEVRTLTLKAWCTLLGGTLEDGSFHAAASMFERAILMARNHGYVMERFAATVGLVDATIGTGRHMEAIDLADRSLRRCLHEGRLETVPALLTLRGTVMMDLGYRQPAIETLESALRLLSVYRRPVWEIRARLALGTLMLYRADLEAPEHLEEIVATLGEAERQALEMRAWPLLVDVRGMLARACEELGQAERAEGFREAQAEAIEQGGRLHLGRRAFFDETRNGEERILVEKGLRVAKDSDPSPCIVFRQLRDSSGRPCDLQVVYRNPAALSLIEHENHCYRLLSELEKVPHCYQFGDALRRAANGESSFDDVEIETTTGNRVFRRRALPSDDGVVMLLEDVTALVAQARSSTRLARLRGEYLANMSHEIRTPLNGVLGLAHLLARSDLEPQQRKWIQGLLSSGDLLHRVINDILDASKIEAGKLEFAREPMSIAAIIHETAALNEPSAREKGLDFCVYVDPSLQTPRLGDGPRLKQILGNLVSNAVRYTDRGEVRITARLIAGRVRFTVEDTGNGIPEDRQDEVFSAFETGRLPESGTGLGLTISRRLVELMGGELRLRSRVGEGSAFTFDLDFPLGPEMADDPLPSDREGAFELRILLVEDNEVNALVAIGHLERLGCEVVRCVDGESVLRLAATETEWDLVLMDVRLPGMSGLSATRLLRRMRGFETMPIVAMTAGALEDEKDACFAAGMDDYLSKPFRPADLVAILRRFTGRRDVPELALR